MKRGFLIVGLALAFAVTLPGIAMAVSTVSIGINATLQVQGGPEDNHVSIVLSGTDYLVSDSAGTSAGSGCSPSGPDVRCPAASVVSLFGDLGGGTDTWTSASLPLPSLVSGGGGNDDLTGGSGVDEFRGQGENDGLHGGPGNDILIGESVAGDSTAGTNTLEGGPGDDTLEGGAGSDMEDGGADNDTLRGFGGSDGVDGGDGNDFVSGGDGDDTLRGGRGNDEVGNPERVGAAGSSAERGNDNLDGGEGDDTIQPGAGPQGGTGDADALTGGPGLDTVTYGVRQASITASIDAVANDGFAGEGDDVRPDVERLLGGEAGDTITGGPGGDLLDGGAGADIVDGAGGGDTIDGGLDAADDRLTGGEGDDTMRGASGDDRLAGDGGTDTLDGGGGTDVADGGPDGDRVEGGAGVDDLAGGSGDDTVRGGALALVGQDERDTLAGGSGDDDLEGGDGNDELDGGGGSDDLDGGAGRDAADYEDAGAAVTVRTWTGARTTGPPAKRTTWIRRSRTWAAGRPRTPSPATSGPTAWTRGPARTTSTACAGSDELSSGAARDVLASRDGKVDKVECGRGTDFAFVDRLDKVGGSCEQADRGNRPPRRGRRFLAQPLGRGSRARLRGMHRNVPFEYSGTLPVGSRVDTTDGSVRLITAGRGRSRGSAVFSRGEFQVRQARSGLTELVLAGGDLAKVCGQRKIGAKIQTAGRRSIFRRVRGRGRGRFRTRGRHSSATVRGTSWEVQDRCNGTLTIVRSGTVIVRDFRKRRNITLRAGQRYLASGRP